jgi:hypothetical protein
MLQMMVIHLEVETLPRTLGVSLTLLTLSVLLISSLSLDSSNPTSPKFVSSAALSKTPQIIQYAVGSDPSGTLSGISLQFASPITPGDVIILCLGSVDTNPVSLSFTNPADSFGNSFSLIDSTFTTQSGASPEAMAAAWGTYVTNGGLDTIAVSFPNTSGPTVLFGYELSGVGVVYASAGSETTLTGGSSAQVPSYTAPAQSLIIACGGFWKSGGLTAGSGYVLKAEYFPPGDVDEGLETAISSGVSTTSQILFGQFTPTWSEVSLAVSAPIAVTFKENGLSVGTSWSATLGGVTESSTTGAISFINVPPGTYLWSTTKSISTGPGTRYFAKVSSGTVNVLSQISLTVKYSKQFEVTFAVSPRSNGATSPMGVHWYSAGSVIQILAAPVSGHTFNDWSSSNAAISITNPTSAATMASMNGPGTLTANFS